MRKAFAVIIGLVLISCGLSGCRDLGRTSVPNEQNFVSAVGFDKEDEEWIFSLRIAGGSEESGKILFTRGNNIGDAFEKIVAGSVGKLQFTHCRAVVLGESVAEEALNMVVLFCIDRLKTPLSARMISADNANSLLSAAEGGNGYEISDIADKTAKELGLGAHSAIYEIETARMQSVSLFALPRFTADDNIRMVGLTLYKDNKPTVLFDMRESRVYALLRNVFEGGEISDYYKSEELKTASSKMDFNFSEDRLFVNIAIRSNPQSALFTEEVKSVLSEFDTDLFGIELQLERKNPEIYEKIKADFEKYYKNAKFTVREE